VNVIGDLVFFMRLSRGCVGKACVNQAWCGVWGKMLRRKVAVNLALSIRVMSAFYISRGFTIICAFRSVQMFGMSPTFVDSQNAARLGVVFATCWTCGRKPDFRQIKRSLVICSLPSKTRR
jgi:hypothetical protein